MLEVEALRFHYPGRAEILKRVSFQMESGKFLAVLGNNGAGKSTMLKCLNKILIPDSGKVVLEGEDVLQMTQGEVAKKIAFVAQTVPDVRMTVHDMVMLGRRPYMSWGPGQHDHSVIHHVMEMLGLISMRGRYVSELSGGERQKVMLARALAQEPALLLLDEPTSSLDLQNQYQVLSIIKNVCWEKGLSVIAVLHDLNLALRFCDSLLLMKNGKVYDYGPKEILNRKALKDVYGVDGEIVDAGDHKIVIVDEIPWASRQWKSELRAVSDIKRGGDQIDKQ